MENPTPKKKYLPLRSAWFGTREIPDGWEDLGRMAPIFKSGEGHLLYSCDNGCCLPGGEARPCRLARLAGQVVMYCPNCRLFEDVPAGDDPFKCKHEWEPIHDVRCKKCQYETTI